MNLPIDELIEAISRRVPMYVDKKRIDYIYYLLLGGLPGRDAPHAEADSYFRFFFRPWSLAWIRLHLAPDYRPEHTPQPDSGCFCWYHYFEDNTDSQEAAVDLFFQVSRLFFEDFRQKRHLEKCRYHLVQMMSDHYERDGISEGMTGYIIEVYDDSHCEVEFSAADGSTVACQAIHKGHFALADDTKEGEPSVSACFDLNLVFPRLPDFAGGLTDICEKYAATVRRCSTIDNWNWDNQTEADWLTEWDDALTDGKIAVMEFDMPRFRNAGMFIEKYKEKYICSLWLSIESCPALDCGTVNLLTKRFYDGVYDAVSAVCQCFAMPYEWMAAGVETAFCYHTDFRQMLSESENIAVWSTHTDGGAVFTPPGYRRRFIMELDNDVFEKLIP